MYFKGTFAQRLYLINNSAFWKYSVIAACCFHCLLAIVEPTAAAAAGQRNNATTLDAPEHEPPHWALGLELLFVAVYLADVALKCGYMGGLSHYYRNNQHKFYTLIIVLLTLDWILFVSGAYALRIFRVVRPGIVIVRSRELRKTAYTFWRMLPELLRLWLWLSTFVVRCSFLNRYRCSGEFANVLSGRPLPLPQFMSQN
jgi:hypothetical protein